MTVAAADRYIIKHPAFVGFPFDLPLRLFEVLYYSSSLFSHAFSALWCPLWMSHHVSHYEYVLFRWGSIGHLAGAFSEVKQADGLFCCQRVYPHIFPHHTFLTPTPHTHPFYPLLSLDPTPISPTSPSPSSTLPFSHSQPQLPHSPPLHTHHPTHIILSYVIPFLPTRCM